VYEYLCRFYLCLLVFCVEAIFVTPNIRLVPGWHGRFSVAPVQVEQPKLLAPRCGYGWLRGL